MSWVTAVDVVRVVCILVSFYTTTEAVWRGTVAHVSHVRYLMVSVCMFSLLAIYTEFTRLGEHPDFRLPIIIVALVCLVLAFSRWERSDNQLD